MKKIIKHTLAVTLNTQTFDVPVNTEVIRVALEPNSKAPTLWTVHRTIDEDERKELKVKFTTDDRQFGNESKYLGTCVVKQSDGTFLALHLLEDFSDE